MTSAQASRYRGHVTGARRGIGRRIAWLRFTRGRDNDRGRHTLRDENEMNTLCLATGDHLDAFQKRPAKSKT